MLPIRIEHRSLSFTGVSQSSQANLRSIKIQVPSRSARSAGFEDMRTAMCSHYLANIVCDRSTLELFRQMFEVSECEDLHVNKEQDSFNVRLGPNGFLTLALNGEINILDGKLNFTASGRACKLEATNEGAQARFSIPNSVPAC